MDVKSNTEAPASMPGPSLSLRPRPADITLAQILRMSSIKHAENRRNHFWSTKLLEEIMTRTRVMEALRGALRGTNPRDMELLATAIVLNSDQDLEPKGEFQSGVYVTDSNRQKKRYLKIFALLLLSSRGRDIGTFVSEGICDQYLPLRRTIELGDPKLSRYEDGRTEIKPFEICQWLPHELDFFYETQWRLNVPYFEGPRSDGTVPRYLFHPETILPWCEIADDDKSGRFGLSDFEGGYSTVKRINIDPSSHGFSQFLKKISLTSDVFAVKILYKKDEIKFQKEVDILNRLGGLVDKHLISLLTTFTLNDKHHMIFPYAPYDLSRFWEIKVGPLEGSPASQEGMMWIASQVVGLTHALDLIHNPRSDDLYGRHGDIKPENILWFQCDNDPLGILVLTDFGLASFNRANSRSNIPNVDIAVTPEYRPPECDIKDALISRRYDIWTLGCLLLEMVAWILGGKEEQTRFRVLRTTIDSASGISSSIFFKVNLVNLVNDDTYVFSVKEEVQNYIATLFQHTRCTGFIGSLLKLVQHRALLIHSPQRADSHELLKELRYFHERALQDLTYLMGRPDNDNIQQVEPKTQQVVRSQLVRQRARSYDSLLLVETRKYQERPLRDFTKLTGQASDDSELQPVAKQTIQGQFDVRISNVIRNNEHHKSHISAKFSGASKIIRQSIRVPESLPRDVFKENDQPSGSKPSRPTVESINQFQFERPAEDHGAKDSQDMESKVYGDLYGAMEETVRRGNSQVATFRVFWQLQQCIRDELDGSLDLDEVLTISGNGKHSWAAKCEEYVRATWGDFGRQLLDDLQLYLRNSSSSTGARTTIMDYAFCSLAEEEIGLGFSTVHFSGTMEEAISVAQFLAWIAATFRIPQAEELMCSSISLEYVQPENYFQIRLRELTPLQTREPGTCWTPLFPTTIMATGFPVLEHSGALGLQIPFAAMLDMAEILYDVSLEDNEGNVTGIYFEGISYLLYPIADLKGNDGERTIQWHLEGKPEDEERDRSMPPDHGSGKTWTRIPDLDIDSLSKATTILGYCENVVIQLGTKGRLEQYGKFRHALANDENPGPEGFLNTVTSTLGLLGWMTFGFVLSFKARRGLRDAREKKAERHYSSVLELAEKNAVILFDTEKQNQRAWMVPQLSVILDLYNYWAHTEKHLQNIRFIQPNNPYTDTARKILSNKPYYKTPVVLKETESDPPDLTISDMVLYIYGQMISRDLKKLKSDAGAKGTFQTGRSGILGWDLKELTYGGAPNVQLDRREIKIPNGALPCWIPFTEKVSVFIGQGLGQLITPAPGAEYQVCRHWNPVPGGLNDVYLVASTACLKALARQYGHDEDWFYFNRLQWEYRDVSLFRPCSDACMQDPRLCLKRPQVLSNRKGRVLVRTHGQGQNLEEGQEEELEELGGDEEEQVVQRHQEPVQYAHEQGAQDERHLIVPSNGAVIFSAVRKPETIPNPQAVPNPEVNLRERKRIRRLMHQVVSRIPFVSSRR